MLEARCYQKLMALFHGGILSDTAASVDAYQMAHELIVLT